MRSDRHTVRGAATTVGDPSDAARGGDLIDGRYRLGRRIARGGMAVVYEAVDTRLDRTVALKIMHPGFGDDEQFAARLVNEARNAARLSHPNVVSVYDQGNDDGTVFLAMELVRGHTLRQVVNSEAPLSPARALALLEPVVAAVAAAHEAGLMHRDVKPENVLIGEASGVTKVADFGLARAVSADTRQTATGVMLGTVSYVAPEIVLEGRADARADVYAIGVMLYELLTGVKPHLGETPIQVAYRHVHDDVPAPSRKVPGIPPYVDALVARACVRDRELRPADAGVLLRLMRRVSAAVAAGEDDDPDLVSDLMPPRRSETPTVETPLEEQTAAESFTPEVADPTVSRMAPVAQLTPVAPEARPAAVTRREAPAPRRTGRRWRGPILLLLALLLAVGVGTGAWWFGWARYTSTPPIVRLAQPAAVERLDAAGLDLVVAGREFSETVPRGEVIRSDPAPGERVLDGGEVDVVLSRGVERYELPKLRGLSEDDAQDAIAEANLTFGSSTERWSEKVPEGEVIGSDPASGKRYRPGTVVDLVVSKGRRPIQVGDWVGEPASEAVAALEGRGLKAEQVAEKYHDTVPEGSVIAQSPAGGTLHRGDTVELTVSKGPELVQIPGGLIASGERSATEELEALGFEVKTEKAQEYIGLHFVFRVSPGSGEWAPKGSTITLYLI